MIHTLPGAGSVLYPYTAERRDVLKNTLPEAQEISRGRRFCTPEGVLESRGVQNPRPWEIFRSSGDVFPKTSLLSAVYGYSIVHCNQKSEQNKVSPPFLPHTIAHCPVKVFTRKLRKFTKRNLSRNCVGDPKQTHRREPYQRKQYICLLNMQIYRFKRNIIFLFFSVESNNTNSHNGSHLWVPHSYFVYNCPI